MLVKFSHVYLSFIVIILSYIKIMLWQISNPSVGGGHDQRKTQVKFNWPIKNRH